MTILKRLKRLYLSLKELYSKNFTTAHLRLIKFLQHIKKTIKQLLKKDFFNSEYFIYI